MYVHDFSGSHRYKHKDKFPKWFDAPPLVESEARIALYSRNSRAPITMGVPTRDTDTHRTRDSTAQSWWNRLHN